MAAATGGIWEAADVQWWSRRASYTDRHDQVCWLNEDDAPTAGVLRTDFASSVQLDVVLLPARDDDAAAAWREALRQAAAISGVTLPVRADDATGVEAVTAAGYQPTSGPGIVSSWLDTRHRPAIPALVPGCELMSCVDAPDGPHPLALRNGYNIEERLRRCSLYQPDLDLRVLAADGRVAGYGVFWVDPVTRVGLVGPMRTEQPFASRGVASHILAAGLDRLARRGCSRLKVSSDIGLYLRAGFRPLPAATAAIYSRPGAAMG
ncbi:MAG: GNAT family N-acetyltransferase [Streptosporangiaceae bacterium]